MSILLSERECDGDGGRSRLGEGRICMGCCAGGMPFALAIVGGMSGAASYFKACEISDRDWLDEADESETTLGTTALLEDVNEEDDGVDEVEYMLELSADDDGARRATGLERTDGVFPTIMDVLWGDAWSCKGGARASMMWDASCCVSAMPVDWLWPSMMSSSSVEAML